MKIRWTDPAVADVQDIYDFIAGEDRDAARRILDAIYSAVEDSLPTHPGIGRTGRVAGTRELVVTGLPFVIPYRVRNGEVQILRVLHGARRWPNNFG